MTAAVLIFLLLLSAPGVVSARKTDEINGSIPVRKDVRLINEEGAVATPYDVYHQPPMIRESEKLEKGRN